MKLLLLFIIGAAWGSFASWYIGPKNMDAFSFLIGFVAIPGALGILFAKAELLILSRRK